MLDRGVDAEATRRKGLVDGRDGFHDEAGGQR
jgi:hypothetical protein